MAVPQIETIKDYSADEMLAVIKDMQPDKIWHLDNCETEGWECTQIYFLHDDVGIYDPTRSDCGRFDADPEKDYGLNPDTIITMMLMNQVLEERDHYNG